MATVEASVVGELDKLRLANAQALELLKNIRTNESLSYKHGDASTLLNCTTKDLEEKEKNNAQVHDTSVAPKQLRREMYDIWGCQQYLQCDGLSYVKQYLKQAEDVLDKNSRLMTVTKPVSYEVVDDVESLLQKPIKKKQKLHKDEQKVDLGKSFVSEPLPAIYSHAAADGCIEYGGETSATTENFNSETVTSNHASTAGYGNNAFHEKPPLMSLPGTKTEQPPSNPFSINNGHDNIRTHLHLPRSCDFVKNSRTSHDFKFATASARTVESGISSPEDTCPEITPFNHQRLRPVDSEACASKCGVENPSSKVQVKSCDMELFEAGEVGKVGLRMPPGITSHVAKQKQNQHRYAIGSNAEVPQENTNNGSMSRVAEGDDDVKTSEFINLILEMDCSLDLAESHDIFRGADDENAFNEGDEEPQSATFGNPAAHYKATPDSRHTGGDQDLNQNPLSAPRQNFIDEKVDRTYIKLDNIKGKVLNTEFLANAQEYHRNEEDIDHGVEKKMLSITRNKTIANKAKPSLPPKRANSPVFIKKADATWDSLPDEMVVRIFSFLPDADLKNLSLVNHRFNSITKDSYLWQKISATGVEIGNDWLQSFESATLRHINLQECSSKGLKSRHLRTLFQNCRHSLRTVHVSECTNDSLSGDNILLHVSSRCNMVESISVPWSNVTNNGMSALAGSDILLKDLDISGNGFITDETFIPFVLNKGQWLQTLKLSGCFALTNEGLVNMSQNCPNLTVLHMGMCAKVTTEGVITIARSLANLRVFDLRGLKSVTDSCLSSISKHCKGLTNIVLANCPQVSDDGIIALTSELKDISILDVAGCVKVTDASVTSLAVNLKALVSLNVSNTGISHVSVNTLTQNCFHSLKTLKISFCSNITNDCVKRLVGFCYNLCCLHIHGCKRVKTKELLSKTRNMLEISF